ncbi:hypothetical protein HXX76_002514 [Chlamydomonas incerta]|uniref:Protein kinase domain-containing protein n=1 Tax=Chlamydomonas incerta TaxID=51695 RepID=A0A835TFF7_CHLIN|nr:hypothetical protein HXX76_002514 [Chlamydomonas incerta]|eukprot:KAG2442428.1 hypothetical protein HXX76_002514 [Chlamydomonas incerta]
MPQLASTSCRPTSAFLESESCDGPASYCFTSDSSVPATASSSIEECASLHSSGRQGQQLPLPSASPLAAHRDAPQHFSLSRLSDMRARVAGLSVLGCHGRAVVLRGVWQLADVAVKLIATPGGHAASPASAGPTSARTELQLLEGPLSKCLRAPNVVETYCYACCYLTNDELEACAAEDAAHAALGGLEREFTRDSGWGGLRTDSFAQAFEQVKSQGLRCDSYDGFGNLLALGACGGAEAAPTPITYSEALAAVEAEPGCFVTQLIMEYCDQGTLADRVASGAYANAGVDRRPLFALLRTLHDVAAGMSYLHTNGIIHGQLTPANVLLRSSRADARGYLAKVSDFGLSACVAASADASSPSSAAAAAAETSAYMAPELFEGVMLRASDVWSFAATAYHCWTGAVPHGHAGLHPMHLVAGVCDGSLRLQRPADMPEPLWRLLSACLKPAWQSRPNFKQIRRALRGMEHTLCGM